MSSPFLPSRSFELFEAIEQKKQISCQYRGYTRHVCPYVLGTNKNGKERVLALLVRNTPSGAIAGGWECLELESVWNVKSRRGRVGRGAERCAAGSASRRSRSTSKRPPRKFYCVTDLGPLRRALAASQASGTPDAWLSPSG